MNNMNVVATASFHSNQLPERMDWFVSEAIDEKIIIPTRNGCRKMLSSTIRSLDAINQRMMYEDNILW